MRRNYSENQVKQMVLEVLKDLGIELNDDEKLEFNVPVVFDEKIQYAGCPSMESGTTLVIGPCAGETNIIGAVEK